MAMTHESLERRLKSIQSFGQQKLKELDEEFQVHFDWLESVRAHVRSGEFLSSCLLQSDIAQTPKMTASPKRVGAVEGQRHCFVDENSHLAITETSEQQVTSTVQGSMSPPNQPLRTLRRRKIKVEYEEPEDSSKDGSQYDGNNSSFKVPAAPSKFERLVRSSSKKPSTVSDENSNIANDRKKSLRSSKLQMKSVENDSGKKTPSTSQHESVTKKKRVSKASSVAKRSAQVSSTSVKGSESPKESIGANNTYTKKTAFPKESIGANSTYVKENALPKESIGANSTYVKESVLPMESIGANSTYIKENASSKESIGANSTYVKESVLPKESIGANSTYTKENASSKESIGANSTYVKESVLPKESIGANSTYTKENAFSKESIGANSTYVLVGSAEEMDIASSMQTQVAESARVVQTVEEASRYNVKISATTSKKISADIKVGSKQVGEGRKPSTPAVMRAARKSLNRAKFVVMSKQNTMDCNPGKIWCKKLHTPISKCSKPVLLGRFQSASQSADTPIRNVIRVGPVKHVRKPSCLSDSKGHGSGSRGPLNRGTPSSFNCEDKLQQLVNRTLKVCQKEPSKQKEERSKNDMHNAKVASHQNNQGTGFKDAYLQKVVHEGFSHLAAPQNEIKNKAVFPSSACKKPPVLQAQKMPVNKVYNMSSYDITLDPEDRLPLPSKNSEDYGLDDANSSDSSDDESKPKRVVPVWAQVSVRKPVLEEQYFIQHRQLFPFFGSKKTTPDLSLMFSEIDRRILNRRSSAVWNSPDQIN